MKRDSKKVKMVMERKNREGRVREGDFWQGVNQHPPYRGNHHLV